MIYVAHVSWVGYVLLYYTDPAQPLTTADEELGDLDHDLSGLSEVCIVRRVAP